MSKLNKKQIGAKTKATEAFRAALADLEKREEAAVKKIEAAAAVFRAAVEGAMSDLDTEALSDASEALAEALRDITTDQEDTWSDRSESWQESSAGSAAHAWLESFASAAEEIEIPSVKGVDELLQEISRSRVSTSCENNEG
jgi:hypothetical protein